MDPGQPFSESCSLPSISPGYATNRWRSGYNSVTEAIFTALLERFDEATRIMFSLQKMFGKEDRFFTLLEASAQEACTSVRALADLSKDLGRSAWAEESAYARQKERQITDEITTAVYTSYITAIQREDIQALSNTLYRISKAADKFTERALIAPRFVQGVNFSEQIKLLEAASGIVFELVKSLRGGMNPEYVKEQIEELHLLENQGDQLMTAAYGELYSGRYDAVQAIFLKDLYELLEKGIDRCRSAGNVIGRIVLKNS